MTRPITTRQTPIRQKPTRASNPRARNDSMLAPQPFDVGRSPAARRRWLVGLLAVVGLLVASLVLARPQNPGGTFSSFYWQASQLGPEDRVEVGGSSAATCDDFVRGSVCAEFRNPGNGSVLEICCVDESDLFSNDRGDCLVEATIQRDGQPIE